MPVDLAEARKQCHKFIAEMADNRPNCDDSGMARRVLDDLQKQSDVTRVTKERLLRWCHTNGTLYQRGVPVAQRICVALYGRVLPRQ